MRKFYIFCVMAVVCASSFTHTQAQKSGNTVDSLISIPGKPCDGDEVSVAVFGKLKCGATVTNTKMGTNGTTITITGTWTTGIICSDSPLTDTIKLGTLTAGAYTVIYQLKNYQSQKPDAADTIIINVCKGGKKGPIDSINVIPDSPCDKDEVFLEVGIKLECGRSIARNDIQVVGNQITVTAMYLTGIICTDTYLVDTISLGSLPAGDYTVTYNYRGFQSFIIEDTETTTFTVCKGQQQAGPIEKVTVDPSDPCEGDSVFINVGVQLKCGKIVNRNSIDVQGTNITVTSLYTVGIACNDSYYSKRIYVGKFSPGTYTLTYALQNQQGGNPDDTKTITFNVCKGQQQAGPIEKVEVDPSNPCDGDDVYINVGVQLKCGKIVNKNTIDVQGNNITVTSLYTVGIACNDSYYSKRIFVGNFSPGIYTLTYALQNQQGGNPDDTKTITFMVCDKQLPPPSPIDFIKQHPKIICGGDIAYVVVGLDLKCGMTITSTKVGSSKEPIIITSEYTTGIACIDRYQTDTINLGILTPGKHTIIYNMKRIGTKDIRYADTLTIEVCKLTGVETNLSKQIANLYVVEANGKMLFNFNMPEGNTDGVLNITDIQGRIVSTLNVDAGTIQKSVSKELFSNGIYIVSLYGNTGHLATSKFIVRQ